MSSVLIRYVLTAALRDRVFTSFLLLLLVGVGLSFFFASAAIIEQAQFMGIYLGSSLRLISIFALILFIVFHVRRSFDSRDVEFLLARPVSRISFILSHAVSFSLIAAALAILVSAVVGGWVWSMGGKHDFWLWSVGLIMEMVIMANVAFFFAMVLSSPVSAGFGCLGFYVLARLMGQLILVMGVSLGGNLYVSTAMNSALKAVSFLIPRFDLMTQTSWLVYGADGVVGYGFILLQAVVFLLLIWTATLIDFVKRQF